MKGKLWKKLFRQVIPFLAGFYMAMAGVWISMDYVLAFMDKTPVGDLTVQIAQGIPVAICAIVLSTGFDHWLQDHYKVDNQGRPRNKNNSEGMMRDDC